MSEALDRLRKLVRDGRAVAQYPEAARLAGAVERDELPRAGRLLGRLDPSEVRAAHPGVREVDVAVTGSGTVAGLIPVLTAEFARAGMLLRPLLGDFGRWEAELMDAAGSVHALRPDLALCLIDPEEALRGLPAPWRVEDAERVLAASLARIVAVATHWSAHGTGTLVLNTVPLLRSYSHQLIDHISRTRFGILWREFNTALLRLTTRFERLAVIDMDPLAAEGGPVRDTRLLAYAEARLGDVLLARYAREIAHLARSRAGLARKVLAVDLDNTLWDGVLAEDGPDGIAAAGTLRGAAFGRFQRLLAQFASQGVLLAVSSKNDREPVLAVLRDHPDLTLREEDFVQVVADWRPKAEHLADIAATLGLATDSFVFVDDTPAECGLVGAALPDVAVVRLGDDPAEHGERLLADGWFDVPILTDEDRARTGSYRAEAARRAAFAPGSHVTGSLPDPVLLDGLGMAVDVVPVRPHEIARVSQLTLRTNQFNLTGERLSEADVRARTEAVDGRVLAVRSRDRYGDQGLVGAVLARRDGDALRVENLLLSCRVLCRGVEQAVLATVLGAAREAGLTAVHARHRPTGRNHRTRDFYPSLGFVPLDATGAGAGADADTEVAFRHDLRELPPVPAHIRLTSAPAATLT